MEIANPTETEPPMQIRLQGSMTGRRTGECTTPRVEARPEGNSTAAPVD
jgi:hypothetical protein